MSAEYRGNPCHETASAPTTRYSTPFEFKHSINSRKSLFRGIGVGSLSQFKKYAGPLLRVHLSAGKGIGGIGLFKTGENTDYFLHQPILRWFFGSGSYPGQMLKTAGHAMAERLLQKRSSEKTNAVLPQDTTGGRQAGCQ